ncbi:DUF4232 domain-containing protein [Streptomyces sp. NPDC049541]|uniref:DUF4232 domain-containing protein n=1 Tax=Streptomyces sp. NPDC049541 TaxID=3365594 RepID=UPI0037A9CC86
MSGLRTSRTRLAAAAATAVLAALSLTACNDGTGAHDEGAASTASTNPSSGATSSSTPSNSTGTTGSTGTSGSTGATGSSGGTSTTGSTTGSKSAGGTSASKASSAPVTCQGSNTKTVAAPLNRPVNHMLLTVTNTGSRTCFLYGYPAVRFTGAQAVPPVITESQPQAVVTLEPGQSGYAAISLSATDGSSEGGHTAKSLTVYFSPRSMSGSVGAPAHPPLPAKGVYVDDSIKVTYWQQDMNDATDW